MKVEVVDISSNQELIARAAEFHAVIGARIPRGFLDKAADLKYVIIPSAGIPPQDKEVLPDHQGIYNS